MTDKNWKDSLRHRMSEYQETPPEGLWEALEAAGAVGGRKAAAAGAGAGLLSRLFGRSAGAAAGSSAGRSLAPVWWSLAGVAAAAAALFLLLPPSRPASPVVSGHNASEQSIIAETNVPDDLDDDMDSRTQNDGVLSTDPTADASPSSNHPSFEYGQPSSSSSQQILRSAQNDKASTDDPSSVVSTDGSSSVISTDGSSSVISTGAKRNGEISSEEQILRDAQNDSQSGDKSSDQQTPGDAQNDSQSTVNTVPKASRPAHGPTTVPLRSIKRSRPLFAATLIGGGMPGGPATSNTVEYGMRSALNKTGTVRQASVLSRNRVTETLISHKMDFQVGLMASFDITDHWGVETGLMYTRLGSSTVSNSGAISSTTEEKFNYIGIPVHVIYTPLQLRLLSVYLSAGPEIEYGLSRDWRITDIINSAPSVIDGGIDRTGDWVLSGSINAGVQIKPFRHGAFFLQPGVVFRHAFDTSWESYYTNYPVSFRLSAGYRITF